MEAWPGCRVKGIMFSSSIFIQRDMPMPFSEMMAFIDLTDLSGTPDVHQRMACLCKKAQSQMNTIAALCIYPEEITTLKAMCSLPIATVANFPSGEETIESVAKTIQQSIVAGAHEVDVVIPYQRLIQGQQTDIDYIARFLSTCRAVTQTYCLKVIIESGQLNPTQIALATQLVCDAGADFVKTSTGKVPIGATLEAIHLILTILKERKLTGKYHPGIKISGGVNSDNVQAFLSKTIEIMGRHWINTKHFRIGTSRLLDCPPFYRVN